MDPADKSVLVVDDEPAVQALLTDAVEASGWTAFTASNAAEALSSLEEQGTRRGHYRPQNAGRHGRLPTFSNHSPTSCRPAGRDHERLWQY